VSLPQGITSRPARTTDAVAIAAVINTCDATFAPEPLRVGEREIGAWLERTVDAVVICDEGEIVAFAGAVPRGGALSTDGAVLPSATGQGIGSFLLDWAEAQGRAGANEKLRTSILAGNEAAKALVLDRGFVYVRSFYRMVIDLSEPPPPPSWPHGIAVEPFLAGQEAVLHEVVEDSFVEHWGHARRSLDDWLRGIVIEPELIFLACEGDHVVGAVMCNEELFGNAFVGILGVREGWRGRGLGRSLLLQGFGALYEKGKRRIGLGVDAGNETGAVRLYESVGMRVGGQDDVYEKRS
jgi:mycothiol synthase